MTHKENCIDHCKQYLQDLSLSDIFDEKHFNHYYRKHNGGMGNAFTIGLKAADMMIVCFDPQKIPLPEN